jgi:hypothetical protein
MKDGYPTNAELKKIQNWPHADFAGSDFVGLLEYVRSRWKFADAGYWRHPRLRRSQFRHPTKQNQNLQKYLVSTAGWSGNEALIGALEKNYIFWLMCWVQSRRGGHYIFEVRKDFLDEIVATRTARNAKFPRLVEKAVSQVRKETKHGEGTPSVDYEGSGTHQTSRRKKHR